MGELNIRLYTVYYYFYYSLKNRVSPLRFITINSDYLYINEGVYSKFKINEMIPRKNKLTSVMIDPNFSFERTLKKIEREIKYPLILKPDWGESSIGVMKVSNKNELKKSLKNIYDKKISYMAQEFCAYENEYDILHISNPNKKGTKEILDITKIVFPCVMGDGESSISKLVDEQISVNQDNLKFKNKSILKKIPKLGESVCLDDINSVLNGSSFIDIKKESKKYEAGILKQVSNLSNFKIAKTTIKANNERDIAEGKFKVIEINILFPVMTSIQNSKLDLKERKKAIKDYIQLLIQVVKNEKKTISSFSLINFYVKNYFHKKKIRGIV